MLIHNCFIKRDSVMRKSKLSKQQKEMIVTLSKALPYLRDDLGVSQSDLAQKVGMSRNMISLIEREKQEMTWTQFLAIVFFFKSNNDFEKGKKTFAKKYPNIVEELLLLESDMNSYEKRRNVK